MAFWTAAGSTFVLIFLAELGDKSQMLAIGLGTRHRLWPIIVGGLLAAATAMALSVVVGGLLATALPAATIALVGGLIFLAFGLWGLWPRAESVAPEHDTALRPTRGEARPLGPGRARRLWGASVLTAFSTIFIAEFGDKTMLVSATLATRGDQFAVWLGATAALTINVALGAAIGRLLEGRIPPRRLEIASGALFAVIGVLLILDSLRN